MATLLRRVVNQVFFTRTGQATIGTTAACVVGSFQFLAESKDFFQHSFRTKKDPDAIVDFYSTEEFLQILGIFDFATHAILAGVEWDQRAENTNTVYNMMRISFDITEKEEEIDGKDVVTFFNKRERFVQYIPYTKILLWDQVQNYGYRRLENGEIEVSHQGESFYGPWPVRFLVELHARYVIWATEKHINSELFGNKDDLEAVEAQRANIPAAVVKEWLADLRSRQEASLLKASAAGNTVDVQQHKKQEEALAGLKRLQRRSTTMYIDSTPGQQGVLTGNVRVNIEEPEAKKAIRDVLVNLKNVEGTEASADALQSLLDKAKGLPAAKKVAAKTPTAPAVVTKADEKLSFGYEQTPQKYKGIFKQRKDQKAEIERNLQRQSSTAPDEMQRWRLEARSLRILEQLNESDQAISTRPEAHKPRLPVAIDVEEVVERAAHRHCTEMWTAYSQCKDNRKGDHSKCTGWWKNYVNCLDTKTPELMLSMLESVAKTDADPNMERLAR